MSAAGVETHTLRLKPSLPWQRRLEKAVNSPARFVVAVMGRRAGKTMAAARLSGMAALRGQRVFWGAPTHDTASLGREKLHKMFRGVIDRQTLIPADTTFLGGGKVQFRSFDRPGAALGRAVDLAIIDEAARVKRQIIYEDLLPTTADTGGKIVAITTPRGRRSWVFEWVQRANGGDPLYAVVNGPSTENPSPEIAEFCAMARVNMPEVLFRQEILAEFVEGEGAVFRRIRECATVPGWADVPAPSASYVIGCDVAKHQDWTVLYALDTNSGQIHGCDRFHHLDWPATEARIATFAARWGGTVWLDSTGVGDAVFDRLAAAGVPVQPFVFGNESKSKLVIALMTAMEQGDIAYPADPTLVGELEAFEYEELPSGKFSYSAPEGLHDDCVMALGLAVWGWTRHTPMVLGWV